MGEMADFYLDQAFDRDQDEYDEYEDSFCDGYYYARRQEKICRYCGLKGLHWEETGDGWRLHDAAGQLHSCLNKKQPFWEIGDRMRTSEDDTFVIANMRLVELKKDSRFRLEYYDEGGKLRGSQVFDLVSVVEE